MKTGDLVVKEPRLVKWKKDDSIYEVKVSMFETRNITIGRLVEELASVTSFFRSTIKRKLLHIMDNVPKEKEDIELLRLIYSIQDAHEIRLSNQTLPLVTGEINNFEFQFGKETGVEFFEHIKKYCIENLHGMPQWYKICAVQIPSIVLNKLSACKHGDIYSHAYTKVRNVFNMEKINGAYKKAISFKILIAKVEYHQDFCAILSLWEDGQHGTEDEKLITRARAKQKSYEEWIARKKKKAKDVDANATDFKKGNRKEKKEPYCSNCKNDENLWAKNLSKINAAFPNVERLHWKRNCPFADTKETVEKYKSYQDGKITL